MITMVKRLQGRKMAAGWVLPILVLLLGQFIEVNGEACKFGIYCDGLNDDLIMPTCVKGSCVCSGSAVQSNCLPKVNNCVMKANASTCDHPASICTNVSTNYICSHDYQTYHCDDVSNPAHEVHVLGSYQASSCTNGAPGVATVQVRRHGETVGRKIVIVLASTKPIAWHLDIEDGITIDQVILVGKTASLMTVSWSGGRVHMVSKLTNVTQHYHSLYGKGRGTIELIQHLNTEFGPITSFTGYYDVKKWRLKVGWPFKRVTSDSTQSHSKTATSQSTPPFRQSIPHTPSTSSLSTCITTSTNIILHPSSVFNAFGTVQLSDISGIDYSAHGTLRLRHTSYNVINMTSHLLTMQTETPSIPSTSSDVYATTTTTTTTTTTVTQQNVQPSSTPVFTSVPDPKPKTSSSPRPSTPSFTSAVATSSYVPTTAPRPSCQTSNPCHKDAICTDASQGFPSCECKDGYVGNGFSFCSDIDECPLLPCPLNSKCHNIPGSYQCICQIPGSCRHTRVIGLPSKLSGRVEVLHNGKWGTVCSAGWDTLDAQVACRDIGYPYLAGILYQDAVPDGVGNLWLSNVNCDGSETKLADCPHMGWGRVQPFCTHEFDIGVQCEPTTVRIIGDIPDEGRVEIFYDGEWGTICDHGWDYDQADLVCLELGFDESEYPLYPNEVPDGSGRIWIDNVRCDGTEYILRECAHDGWGNSSTCDHSLDTGVKCVAKVSCDFELNTCSWRYQNQGGDFEWRRNRGSTPTLLTGPSFDHTLKTTLGAYVYIETSGRQPGQQALLVSPPLQNQTNACLKFYYHMLGSDIAQLNVNLRDDETLHVERLWNLHGSMGNWLEARVPLNFVKRSQLIFEAISGQDQKGDIALDDIVLSDQPCTLHPAAATPDLDECKTKPCHANATCTNTIGSYTCKCNKGFTGNGTECTDMNECATSPCHVNATCQNIGGGYHCRCNNNTEGICDDPYAPCGLRHTFRRTVPKIIGGATALKGSWPWQVAIYYPRETTHVWCGGALINHHLILTAAHCFDRSKRADDYYVVLGEHDVINQEPEEQRFKLKTINVHPGYQAPSKNFDIAMLVLSSSVNYTSNIAPACLPSTEFPAGTYCYISGWGTRTSMVKDYPQFLHQGPVPIVSRAACASAYSFLTVTPYMMCAGYTTGTVDTCQGDSGGPLVCEKDGKWYLAGLTSFGFDCAAKGYPGVYARVTEFQQWIYSHIAA